MRHKSSTVILSLLLACTSIFSCISFYKLKETQDRLTSASSDLLWYESSYNELAEKYKDLFDEKQTLEEKCNRLSDQYDDAQDRCRYYEDEISDLKKELKQAQEDSSKNLVTTLIPKEQQTQSAPSRSSPQLQSQSPQSSSSSSSSSGSSRSIPYKENYHGHVYRTKTGECYHYESPCGRGNYFECTWEDVDRLGLRPCGKCVMH